MGSKSSALRRGCAGRCCEMCVDACHGMGECVVNKRDSESLCSPGMGVERRVFQASSLAIALGLAFWADCKGSGRQMNYSNKLIIVVPQRD